MAENIEYLSKEAIKTDLAVIKSCLRLLNASISYSKSPGENFSASENEMAEHVLDLRGLRCPLPVLKAKKAMKSIPIGDLLVLECTDPLTVIDVPHYVNQDGHDLASQEQSGKIYRFTIVKAR